MDYKKLSTMSLLRRYKRFVRYNPFPLYNSSTGEAEKLEYRLETLFEELKRRIHIGGKDQVAAEKLLAEYTHLILNAPFVMTALNSELDDYYNCVFELEKKIHRLSSNDSRTE